MQMKECDLNSMSVDELWTLHEETVAALADKIIAEKATLEQRLHELGQDSKLGPKKLNHARRPYPQVFPKYRNPAAPAETWAGRGKQPRWLTAQLRSGKKLDDFRIQPGSQRPRRQTG
jgi:DNA-binding protein H-NS